jgi:hypothetical protein
MFFEELVIFHGYVLEIISSSSSSSSSSSYSLRFRSVYPVPCSSE